MAISGSSCSTSNCLTAYSASYRQQSNEVERLANEEKNSRQTSEYIFRGELLDQTSKNNSNRRNNEQTIDPLNQNAINNYEQNNKIPIETLSPRQGVIVDAYA